LRSKDILLHRREKPLTRTVIEQRIKNWEGMRELNRDDFRAVSSCNRALEIYHKMLKELEAS
jgi:hypothetical protein